MKRTAGLTVRTIDEYLAPLSAGKRVALQNLRRAIRAAAPRAEECISYGIPAFRIGGKMIVAFGAAVRHCAFYAGAAPVQGYRDELASYGTSKGTIRFQPERPLPAALVRKLVKAQIAAKVPPKKRAGKGKVAFFLAALLAAPLARAQARSGEGTEMLAEIEELRRQVGGLQASLHQRDEWLDALKKDVGAVGGEVAALKERVASPVALPFLSGPPPSSDVVGVSKVAVFAPRIAVDALHRHDIVFLRVKRVEPGNVRLLAEVELGSDQTQVDLPVDQNGALYVVDWQTSEGQAYNLLLRDGSAGPDSSTQPAASVQVKQLQNQGRFIFVGYRVE